MPLTKVLLILFAGLLAVAMGAFQYFFRTTTLRRYHWILGGLRAITVFSVLLLLINPKFTTTQYFTEKPNLVIAVDNSSSIENLQKSEEVFNFVSKVTQNPDIQENFEVQVFTFGKSLEKSDTFSFSERQTNIHGALKGIDQIYSNSVSPTVLITDGNQTYGRDYRYDTNILDQDLFPVVVGDTSSYKDLAIGRINVNKYAFLKNQFPIETIVTYSGTGAVQSQFQIKRGETVVFKKNISLSEADDSQVLQIYLPANSIGKSAYKAELEPLPLEKDIHNNNSNFVVEVIDERSTILILTDLLHPDLGALKKSIESNQQREVVIKYLNNSPPKLGEYDLVILYQPTGEFKKILEEIDQEEMPYWIITGPETDWHFLNHSQNFFAKNITDNTEEYFPLLNRSYTSFQVKDIGFSDFPPLIGTFGEVEGTTGFKTLLYQQVQGIETQSPLFATLEVNNAKRAFLFGANIWKWRSHVFTEKDSFETFDSFLGAVIQFLASNQKKDRLTLAYNDFYFGNESVRITAQYFDENYNFDPRATLNLEFENPASGEKQVIPFHLMGNKYEAVLNQLSSGEYDFQVKATGEGISDTGKFTIVDSEVENQFTNANLTGLQDVAKNQQNEVYFLKDSEKLVEDLLSNNNYSMVQKSRKNHVSLIDWYYLLAIAVLSLSIEWFLRKYHGLI